MMMMMMMMCMLCSCFCVGFLSSRGIKASQRATVTSRGMVVLWRQALPLPLPLPLLLLLLWWQPSYMILLAVHWCY